MRANPDAPPQPRVCSEESGAAFRGAQNILDVAYEKIASGVGNWRQDVLSAIDMLTFSLRTEEAVDRVLRDRLDEQEHLLAKQGSAADLHRAVVEGNLWEVWRGQLKRPNNVMTIEQARDADAERKNRKG